MFKKAQHYFILLFAIKYLQMFNMSDLSIELQSTEKSHTFPFKDASLDSILLNPLHIVPRKKWVRKLTFLLSALI